MALSLSAAIRSALEAVGVEADKELVVEHIRKHSLKDMEKDTLLEGTTFSSTLSTTRKKLKETPTTTKGKKTNGKQQTIESAAVVSATTTTNDEPTLAEVMLIATMGEAKILKAMEAIKALRK
jgi:hypothetical protein